MFIIGITGGTGAGKTTALGALESFSVRVLDADAVYHELLISNSEMKTKIGSGFSGVLIGNAVDRKKLGEIVFNDPAALLKLNSITHRYVDAEIDQRLANWEAQGETIAAIDAIALIESGRADKCDVVVGVTAPVEMRIARIMERDGITRRQAEVRIKAQKPAAYYREKCDHTLEDKYDTPEEFRKKCVDFFSELLRGARRETPDGSPV